MILHLKTPTARHDGLYNSCEHLLVDKNGIVFVCSYGYYNNCYSRKYKYCIEFYKKRIYKNIQKFLTQIKKEANIFTKKDLDNDNNDIESNEEEFKEIKKVNISSRLIVKINQIEY
ncbi:16495_t:CDS:2 [Dentiscutata heterogama]|uniref:16495_t:CDS:1 n=1 Tax=Dentiscutata heterogama TaxID=1316150 RepID=A0ACA9KU63_9GLOM|nr:16495_t:CDS:2 [Dentiscutata heterogama]